MKNKQFDALWELLLDEFPEIVEEYGVAYLDLQEGKSFRFKQGIDPGSFGGDHFLEITYVLPRHKELEKLEKKLSKTGKDRGLPEIKTAAGTGYLFPAGFKSGSKWKDNMKIEETLVCEVHSPLDFRHLRGFLSLAVLLGDAFLNDVFRAALGAAKAPDRNSGLGFENFQKWQNYLSNHWFENLKK